MADPPEISQPSKLLGDDLLGRLTQWVAEARADEAAAARSRERWIRTAAAGDTTFAGLLVDLAERAASVVVHGIGARRHRGRVLGVGADFVAIESDAAELVLLALASVAAVRREASADALAGDRDVHLELTLADAAAALAGDRPRVLVVTMPSGEGFAGELRSAGRDVISLRLDGGASTAHVPVPSIAELRLVAR